MQVVLRRSGEIPVIRRSPDGFPHAIHNLPLTHNFSQHFAKNGLHVPIDRLGSACGEEASALPGFGLASREGETMTAIVIVGFVGVLVAMALGQFAAEAGDRQGTYRR